MSNYPLWVVSSILGDNTWYNLIRDLEDLSELVGQDVSGGGVFKVGIDSRVYVPKGYYCDVVNRDFNTLKKMHLHGEEVAKSCSKPETGLLMDFCLSLSVIPVFSRVFGFDFDPSFW